MVDDHDVCVAGAVSGLQKVAGGIAGFVEWTGAGVLAGYHVPAPALPGGERQFRNVAGGGVPSRNGFEQTVLVYSLVQRRLVLVVAEVVAASLEGGPAQCAWCNGAGGFQRFDCLREVFADELLLEVDGGGGDGDPDLGILERCEDGGGEVGQSFPGAGAGFDDEVLVPVEGSGDGCAHRLLVGAWFVARDVGSGRLRRRPRGLERGSSWIGA